MGTTVLNGQSFADLAIENHGTLEAVIDWAFQNGMSVTDELEAGNELLVPETENAEPSILNYYRANKVRPATALTDDDGDIVDNNDPCDLCKCFT